MRLYISMVTLKVDKGWQIMKFENGTFILKKLTDNPSKYFDLEKNKILEEVEVIA